jgi:hypothetical protein
VHEVIPGSRLIQIFYLVQSTNVHTSVDLVMGAFINEMAITINRDFHPQSTQIHCIMTPDNNNWLFTHFKYEIFRTKNYTFLLHSEVGQPSWYILNLFDWTPIGVGLYI